MPAVPALILHGGAGSPPLAERPARQAAVDRSLVAAWPALASGALAAVIAAVRAMEDEPELNAGFGACLNADGAVELDAAVMDGTDLRVGAVGAVTDVRHPVDLARAVMDDGRHVLLVGPGATRFGADRGIERCDPASLITPRRREQRDRDVEADTVGAVARDADGRLAVAVSTGGINGKLPGRIGDSPLPGAGFYADDALGAACATGLGEAFMRLCLCHGLVVEMGRGAETAQAASAALQELADRTGGYGGVIAVGPDGPAIASFNTPFMPWAARHG